MIVVGGENLIDLVQEVGGVPKEVASAPGESVPFFGAHPGGGPFNTALAVGRQQQAVGYATPISTDTLGDMIAESLQTSGVQLCVPRVANPTSLALVSVEDGHPSYSFYRTDTAERQVSGALLGDAMPSDARIFHTGGLALVDGDDAEAWEQHIRDCYERGIITSLDPNVRPVLIANADQYRHRIRGLLRYVNVLKMSNEDVLWLYPAASLSESVAQCRADTDAALFVLTKGADGARFFVGKHEVAVASVTVSSMADTVGCGDIFMATILTWLAERSLYSAADIAALSVEQLQQCGHRAAVAAALNCQHKGCQPPTKADIDAVIPH